jgi:hypothetical protein
MLFKYAKGATPLSPDEVHNLIPSHITTQKQLDEWEQYNIVQGSNWAFSRKRKDLLSIRLFRISWDVAINVNMGYSVIGKIYNPQ